MATLKQVAIIETVVDEKTGIGTPKVLVDPEIILDKSGRTREEALVRHAKKIEGKDLNRIQVVSANFLAV
jgi:hypothetical protein